jgi:molybdenum cofactor synthesis domain-containing protein
MVDLEDVQRLVLEACPPLAPVTAELAAAVGRVLAADVVAGEDVPPFANSAVDGYAVRAADVPGELRVVGEVAAGAEPYDGVVGAGEAVRIMTGAPIPEGADAVAMVEDSERLDGGRVRLDRPLNAGASVRGVGDDVRAGELVVPAGTVVSPAVAGVLASINARSPSIVPSARVAVLSTGDELVTDGSPLRPGQIRESNATMLAPLLAEAGCVVDHRGVVPDDEATLEAVLRDAASANDAVVTSGGVSMGDYDVVKAVLGRIAEMKWLQVAIKPAKPFAFGLLDGTPVFGLPGNPVSSLVSFELLARPALRRMMGHGHVARPSLVGVTDGDLRRQTDGKVHFVRVTGTFADDGRYHVRPVSAQGSHQLAATALADALVVLPDGDGVPAGTDVAVVMLRG